MTHEELNTLLNEIPLDAETAYWLTRMTDEQVTMVTQFDIEEVSDETLSEMYHDHDCIVNPMSCCGICLEYQRRVRQSNVN